VAAFVSAFSVGPSALGHKLTAMRRVFVGAAVVVAGIAAFIEAHSHLPESESRCPHSGELECVVSVKVHVGLSPTAYDLLRIGAWALVIVGGLLIVVGLIGYWGAQRDARA
jgi:hypothetical protein